jgi:hypothetical protein
VIVSLPVPGAATAADGGFGGGGGGVAMPLPMFPSALAQMESANTSINALRAFISIFLFTLMKFVQSCRHVTTERDGRSVFATFLQTYRKASLT